jgi:predicted nuclease with TOPRIM domain
LTTQQKSKIREQQASFQGITGIRTMDNKDNKMELGRGEEPQQDQEEFRPPHFENLTQEQAAYLNRMQESDAKLRRELTRLAEENVQCLHTIASLQQRAKERQQQPQESFVKLPTKPIYDQDFAEEDEDIRVKSLALLTHS